VLKSINIYYNKSNKYI